MKNTEHYKSLLSVPYEKAKTWGVCLDRDGYHQPDKRDYNSHLPDCGCENTTKNGAYRDETFSVAEMKFHFYHQNLIVAEDNGFYHLSSCGWKTMTTKERINRYLPRGYRLYQKDKKWYISAPNDETFAFEDGMVIRPDGTVVYQL